MVRGLAKLDVRPYRPSDADSVRALLHTRPELDDADADRRADMFQWLAEHNPHAGKDATYFVAVDRETQEVLAYIGRMPLDAYWRGEPTRLYFGHDLYMHPDRRNQGASGFFTTMKLYGQVEKSPGPVGLLWTSPLNLEFQRRRGYTEVSSLRLVKVLDPIGKVLPGLPRPVADIGAQVARWSMSFAERSLKRVRGAGVEVSRIRRFDERFDAFAERTARRLPLVVKRDAAYLNWKYIDRPNNRFESFAATVGGELRGFMTLLDGYDEKGEAEREGFIVDYLLDPDETASLNALCHHATLYFLERCAVRIHLMATERRLIEKFNQNLFLSRPVDPLMVINADRGPAGAQLDTLDGWQINCGDSDGLCFWGLGRARE